MDPDELFVFFATFILGGLFVRGWTLHLSLLLNAAGVQHSEWGGPERSFMFYLVTSPLLSPAGIDEQGLYRIVGVSSRVQKLLSLAMGKTQKPTYSVTIWNKVYYLGFFIFNLRFFSPLDPKTCADVELENPEWEIKTITSAIKHYLRFVWKGLPQV